MWGDPNLFEIVPQNSKKCIYLFERVTKRQKRKQIIFYLQILSPNVVNGHGWARLKPETPSVSHAGTRVQPLVHLPLLW